MEKIIFTLEHGSEWVPEEYYPTPCVKAVPQWYKKMETSHASDKTDKFAVRTSQTIKRCMPVFDAITTGYVLKTYSDIYVKYENEELKFEWSFDTTPTVTFHPAYQLINYREEEWPQGAPKLRNPWGIKTPKGYSCLFIPPTHRPASGIRILEGIVDTDLYTNPVNFPFVVDKDFTGTIPAGTPVVQVIPFQRSSFRMEIGDIKQRDELRKVSTLLRSHFINGYRNRWRADKDYL